MNPSSLRQTLPDVDVGECFPAKVSGLVRTWTVAFPNDGSQTDKRYVDSTGAVPDVVLFVNLEDKIKASVELLAANGILIPVTGGCLKRLARRELRYEARDVTNRVGLYSRSHKLKRADLGIVYAFVGREEFTRPEDVRRGVISLDYNRTIERGVTHWGALIAGFEADYKRSTFFTKAPIVNLVQEFGSS